MRNVIVAYDGPGFRDIDSARMVLRVEEGKGRKGRYAMLFLVLLDILREWWRIGRQGMAVSGPEPGQPDDHTASKGDVSKDCGSGVQRWAGQ